MRNIPTIVRHDVKIQRFYTELKADFENTEIQKINNTLRLENIKNVSNYIQFQSENMMKTLNPYFKQ